LPQPPEVAIVAEVPSDRDERLVCGRFEIRNLYRHVIPHLAALAAFNRSPHRAYRTQESDCFGAPTRSESTNAVPKPIVNLDAALQAIK